MFSEKELARVQRTLSKAPKGSFERKRALKVVERVHDRIANCRSDFVNKVSRDLVDRFGLIVFEDLDIRKMIQNHNLAKSISDVAWGMLDSTQSKAAYAGSEVVLVDPMNTSQICSRCGILVKKEPADRVHNCPECGLDMDRDLNAAIKIYSDWGFHHRSGKMGWLGILRGSGLRKSDERRRCRSYNQTDEEARRI